MLEMPVSGLQISNIIASGKAGMKAYNTVGLELHNIQVNPDNGPAFLIRDSKDLVLDQVTTKTPKEGIPVIRLDRCPDALVRASRAWTGTGTFLSVGLEELKSIALEGNSLSKAAKPTEEKTADFWKTAAAR